MTPQYQALLQLVDYPRDPEHFAEGDHVVVDGQWGVVSREVGNNDFPFRAIVEGRHHEVFIWDIREGRVARIPGILLQLLQPTPGSPYR